MTNSQDLENFVGGWPPEAFSVLLRIFQDLERHGRAPVAAVEDLCFEMKTSPHEHADPAEFEHLLMGIVVTSFLPVPQARLRQLFETERAKTTSRLDGSSPKAASMEAAAKLRLETRGDLPTSSTEKTPARTHSPSLGSREWKEMHYILSWKVVISGFHRVSVCLA